MAIQPDLKSESPRPTEASLDALSPVLAEYSEALGAPVRIEVPRRRVARPRGRCGWTLHPFAVVEDVVGSESITGVITEYPVPLTLEPARTPLRRGDARRRK